MLIASVPNAMSIHRQVGVEMGIIEDPFSLSESDVQIGHNRVYSLDTLVGELSMSGLQVVATGGLFMKFLAQSQLESVLADDQIEAMVHVGRRYPEIAAEIWAACEK